MRILIVCDFLLRYASEQARSLSRIGIEVTMLCRSHALDFGGSTPERDKLLNGLEQEGVRVLVVPGRIRSAGAIPAIVNIRREIRRWQPDVVHVHENHDPRLLALTIGYRTVLTVHDPSGHPGAPELSRGETWSFKRWFQRADRFVVHGQALADELAPLLGGGRIAVIPHGTSPLAEPLAPPQARSVLLFGRLEQYKGVEVLVGAMQRVWERRPDVQLVVAGTGVAAQHVPADSRIHLIARYVPEKDIDGLFEDASLVALPYTQASQSGVGLQAIGRGIPVIVSDLGSLRELALDSSFVVPPGNIGALADAIIRHIDDEVEVRQAVLRHARVHFSWQHVAQLNAELYRELVAEHRRTRRMPPGKD